MKIAILLPYKENYSKIDTGAVSIFINGVNKLSKFKNDINIYGSTNFKPLSKNYQNLIFKKKFLQSSSKIYIKNFLKKIEKKKIDILVGTQLLSKGFHFPKLNCIVVIDADFSSHGYDLRSAEKNIQLYHQLAGRAGRAGKESTIYFQTYSPEDEILLNISKNDPHAFLDKELLLRKEKKLPPFYRLISLIVSPLSHSHIQSPIQSHTCHGLVISHSNVCPPHAKLAPGSLS